MSPPPTPVQLAPTQRDPREVLAEAAWWCAEHFDPARPATSSRSPDLAPRRLEASYARSVDCVISARSFPARALVRGAPLPPGRLLVYFPDADLCDGAAEAATDGYLDTFNCPPHDTWVALFRDEPADARDAYATYLIAWVPAAWIPRVSEGIRVNPEECIAWLNDTQVGGRRVFSP